MIFTVITFIIEIEWRHLVGLNKQHYSTCNRFL